MHTVFCRFQISLADEGVENEQLMEQLMEQCWNWALKSASKLKGVLPDNWVAGEYIGKGAGKGDKLSVEDMLTESGRLWKLIFNNTNLKTKICWVNHIYLARIDDGVEFSILQEALTPGIRIGPFSESILPPFIIRDLVWNDSLTCSVGEEIISGTEPIFQNNGEEVFDEVTSDSRDLPIVILSKTWATKKSIVDPFELAKKLTGVAKIVIISNLNARKFNEKFGKQWVSNGSIRIHWPGKTETDLEENQELECLFSKHKLISRFDDDPDKLMHHIINQICSATVSNFQTSKAVKQISSDFAKLNHIKQWEEDEKKFQEIIDEIEHEKDLKILFQEEIDKKNARVSELSLQVGQLTNEIVELKESAERFERQYEKLKSEMQDFSSLKHLMLEVKGKKPELTPDDFVAAIRGLVDDEEEEEPEPEVEFDSIYDALLQARREFGARVTILDDAMSSAEKTTSDASPQEVYELVKFLHDDVQPSLKKGPLEGKNRYVFNNEVINRYSSKKFAPVGSKTTVEKYGNEKNPNGRKFGISEGVLIEIYGHLKFGSMDNPLRIHLCAVHEKSKPVFFVKVVQKKKHVWRKKINFFDWQKYFPNIKDQPRVIIGWCGKHLPID